MDGASVNFGAKSGSIKLICEHVGWDVFKFHGVNHPLVVVIKESYEIEPEFNVIKDAMDHLYRTFKCSGKVGGFIK